MREYKFRGKRIDNKEWVVGYYIPFNYEVPNDDYTNTQFGHFILPLKKDGTPPHESDVHFEVIPETIGQYTGLKDSNEKEIYEGDIYEAPLLKTKFKIMFVAGAFCCGLSETDCSPLSWDKDNVDNWSKECTVIGNIHDNP